MRYEIVTTHRFEKAFKRCRKRGYPMEALRVVLNLIGYWSGNRIIIKR